MGHPLTGAPCSEVAGSTQPSCQCQGEGLAAAICTKCQGEFTSQCQEQGNPLLARRQSLIDQVLIVIAMSMKSLTRKILGQ